MAAADFIEADGDEGADQREADGDRDDHPRLVVEAEHHDDEEAAERIDAAKEQAE
ncbi:hypothetical protein D3C72_2511350 [compost metagenome]